MRRRPLHLLVPGVLSLLLVLFVACDTVGDDAPASTEEVFPRYVDNDGDGINDYVEAGTHDSGTETQAESFTSAPQQSERAPAGHSFVDENDDGICDYAQNGSATWHGPGFVDEDGDGVCDYWDESMPRHRHQGMRFRDQNQNRINDYVEQGMHQGPGHAFVDENGDGICDRAQDGSPTWHGPNFVDENGDGRCDYWEPGGRGHGHAHQGGHHGGGP